MRVISLTSTVRPASVKAVARCRRLGAEAREVVAWTPPVLSGQAAGVSWSSRSFQVWATSSGVEYLGWFNHTRLHEALDDRPPVEFEPLYAAPNETITQTIMS